jgi:hypothetical protein
VESVRFAGGRSKEDFKVHYQASLQELENLYGSLSQWAFKGKLGFRDEELALAAEPREIYSKPRKSKN